VEYFSQIHFEAGPLARRYNVLSLRDFRLPPQCKRDNRSSAMLHSEDRLLVTDVSRRQPIGPIVNGQAVQKEEFKLL